MSETENPEVNKTGYEQVNTGTKSNDKEQNDHEEREKSDIRGDRMNILLLFLLYFLQGVPMGLTGTIPILLQNRGSKYTQLAKFSFVFYPFSLKLLWAPIVDALFWSRIGRRKSWLVPAQYIIGSFLLIASAHVNDWLGNELVEPNMPVLIGVFFTITFLTATQDIAVDGWALTMLQKRNVGYASTCNSIGQTTGAFIGYTVLIALESSKFCNKYLRSTPSEEGIITLPGFMRFWGTCFLVLTTLVALFKSERNKSRESSIEQNNDKEEELGILDTYKLLYKIIKLRPVKILIVVLLTAKLTFAASSALTNLKMIERGITKEAIALLRIPLIPLQVIVQIVVSKYTAGPTPLNVYIRAMVFRIIFDLTSAGIVAIIPYFTDANGEISFTLYGILIVNNIIHAGFMDCMFVAQMAFFAKVSDPLIGGTYMTLLNTIMNLGYSWTASLILWLVDILTWKQCVVLDQIQSISNVTLSNRTISDLGLIMSNTCRSKLEEEQCRNLSGKCNTTIDGYYLECLFCLLYGMIWFKWGTSKLRLLQSLPLKTWKVAEEEKAMQPLTEA